MDEDLIQKLNCRCQDQEQIIALQAKEIRRLNKELLDAEQVNKNCNEMIQKSLSKEAL